MTRSPVPAATPENAMSFDERLTLHRAAYRAGLDGYQLDLRTHPDWARSLSASWQLGARERARAVAGRPLHGGRFPKKTLSRTP